MRASVAVLLLLLLLVCACDGPTGDATVDGASPPAADAFTGCSPPCTTDCAPEQLAPGAPWQVALAGSHVYWTDRSAGTLSRRPRAGGAVEVLTTGMADPDAFAIDGDQVYIV